LALACGAVGGDVPEAIRGVRITLLAACLVVGEANVALFVEGPTRVTGLAASPESIVVGANVAGLAPIMASDVIVSARAVSGVSNTIGIVLARVTGAMLVADRVVTSLVKAWADALAVGAP